MIYDLNGKNFKSIGVTKYGVTK